MPSPDVDRLRIGNECNNPVEVIVALEERSNFQMFNKTVPADSDKTYTIRKSDIEDRAPEVYWTARSEDRKTVWVEKDVNAGGAFWIEGEQILFFPLAKERDGSYYVRLSCPTSS